MKTECTKNHRSFQALGRREIVTDFSGGTITSDGGALLLREVEQRTAILQRFAQCFTDYRKENRIEHDVLSLVSQRVLGLALGYEDINDHDQLARDQMLAIAVGKSTLNRLELTAPNTTAKSPYKKIALTSGLVDNLLIDIFLESYLEAPEEIILDIDATDDPLHGNQEGKFFHGYTKHTVIYRCTFFVENSCCVLGYAQLTMMVQRVVLKSWSVSLNISGPYGRRQELSFAGIVAFAVSG